MSQVKEAVRVEWEFYIGQGECIKCASCCSIAPEHFRVDDSSAHIVRQPANETEVARCDAAMFNCPTDAIFKKAL